MIQFRKRLFRPLPSLLVMLILAFVLDVGTATAQSANIDDSELLDLNSQIQADRDRLLETERAEAESRRTVGALGSQIESTRARVVSFRSRLDRLAEDRDSLYRSIDEMENRLQDLKTEYRARATYAYKFGRLHDVALIMSAGSINQMLIRIQYLHRFSNQRQGQLSEIRDATEELKIKREALQRTLIQNEVILKDAERETAGLAQMKKSKQSEVRRLEAQKQLLTASITEKRTEMDNLVTLVSASDDPARAQLADNIQRTSLFEGRKGSLPWPIYGNVKEPYGEVVNPELGTRTDNVGIIIEAEASTEVTAVFDGRVRLVDVMPGLGRVVFVEHGEYLSVYGNFSLLYVGKGDEIKSGQVLGRSGTDAEPRGRTAFFGIFHNGEPTDPQRWLAH